jgi:hypothetical protein
MTFTGINPKFAFPNNIKEQIYPAWQVNNYKPRTLDEEIKTLLDDPFDLKLNERDISNLKDDLDF